MKTIFSLLWHTCRASFARFGWVLCLALVPPCAHAQPKYSVVDLGGFRPVAVNNTGMVAGDIDVVVFGRPSRRAARYHFGEIIEVNSALDSNATGINNRGDVCGNERPGLGPTVGGFLYTAEGNTTYSIFARYTHAVGVNDAGHVALIGGFDAIISFAVSGAFGPVTIGYAGLYGINNRDEVIGSRLNTGGFLYSNGVYTYLPTLGGPTSTPYDINDASEIVGSTTTAAGEQRAFLYSKGVITNLGTLPGYASSWAEKINNIDQIVGGVATTTTPSTSRPFFYEGGVMVDLNTLVDLTGSAFSELTSAVWISDPGFIVGYGKLKAGGTRGYLLVPTPLVPISQPPGWWTAREVIDPSRAPNDYAVVNQGQVKRLARKAYDELEASLAGGAGPVLAQLVSSWGNPANAADYAAINQGQLKSIAKLFYDRLAQAGYHGPPLAPGQSYPWSTTTADNADYAAVNIGQLKRIFSFDLAGPDTASDDDGA